MTLWKSVGNFKRLVHEMTVLERDFYRRNHSTWNIFIRLSKWIYEKYSIWWSRYLPGTM